MMKKSDAEDYFKECYMPCIRTKEAEQSGGVDKPRRRTDWNDYIDAMVKDNQLPEAAYDWVTPRWLYCRTQRV